MKGAACKLGSNNRRKYKMLSAATAAGITAYVWELQFQPSCPVRGGSVEYCKTHGEITEADAELLEKRDPNGW